MSGALLQHLVNLTVTSSVALLVVLLLRPILRRHGGAALVYASWWLLPLALLTSTLPQPAIHTPVFSLPVATIVATSSSTTVSSSQSLTLATLWLLAWGVGAALAAAWMAWQQVRFVRSLGWLQPGLQGSVYFAADTTPVGPLLLGLLRPRIVLYSAILLLIIVASAWSLASRVPLKVDVIRDRSLLAREADDGRIENVYNLKIMNTTEEPKRYALSVEGMEGVEIAGERIVEVASAENHEVTVVVRVPPESGKKGANTIYFDIKAMNHDKIAVHEKASFLMP